MQERPEQRFSRTPKTAAILVSLLLQHGVSVDTIRHSVGGPIAIAMARFGDGAE
jgi:hypothetical protein